MKLGDTLTLSIIDYDHEGRGVAKENGFPIFVCHALKGEVIKGKIEYINKNYAQASIVKVIEESPARCHNVCKYYTLCGGCNIFHIDYDEQLRFKRDMVKTTLKRIGNIDFEVDPVVKNPNPLHYRNKIIVPFKEENGCVLSGFFEAKSHKLVPQDQCLIENEHARIIIEDLKKEFEERNVSIYDEQTHKGLVRNVMLRANKDNELMLVLIVTKENITINIILNKIFDLHKNIKSVYLNINNKPTNVILSPDGFKHLYGDKYIVEDINGLKFKVHPNSFLQVNHDQAEAMYNHVLSLLGLANDQTVIDAYCGIGSITLNLALKANHVYGIEVVPQAIMNAKENMGLNNITNATFICGKCEEEIQKLVKVDNVDAIVFDPPRKGCDKHFLDTVIAMKIKKIVYVSCLPQSLARDLRYLIDNGYELKRVTPFDLFSQCSHVECVCLLTKVN